MKALLLSLCLFIATSTLQAQDLATTHSIAAVGYAGAEPNGPLRLPVIASPVELAAVSIETEAMNEFPSGQAMTQFNGVTLEVQTLPASGTVLITFSMPAQQGLSVLEVANARTGEVVYTGSLLISIGQVELPVTDTTQPFEVRLSTDRDMIIARMEH